MSSHAYYLEMEMKKFNELETHKDLANVLNVPLKKITYILYKKGTENSYRTFEIPKKNGDFRRIHTPNRNLKDIQKKLAVYLIRYQYNIWQYYGIKNSISHGFQKNKSIITNAEKHRNKRYVLNVDLKDFFESFHFGRVKGFFQKNKHFALPEKLAIFMAQLTCYNGHLPQGAPSSPVITNLICNILDMKIVKLTKSYKLNYTRYADDLTFSTNNKEFLKQTTEFLCKLSYIIEKSGLKINDQKTRLLYKNSRQEVTGLVVNEKVNVNRNYYKNTRAMAHSLYTKGEYKIDNEIGNVNQLEGRFSFINQLDWYNNFFEKKKDRNVKIGFYHLNSREKEYQKFLFYKYFFANNKPLIITEGKTDISYLKAALKSLHQDYPSLIEKEDNDSFNFKVSFLRRSKRLSHFLNINKDGADMMKNIYNFFSDKENVKYPNYSREMQKTGIMPHNPVILVFDNETTNNNKPLRSFLNYCGLWKSKEFNPPFKDGLSYNVCNNLNIVTHQLLSGKEECEIEDLFDEVTLSFKINGKKFNRNEKHAKVRFARHISYNYENVNFDNFRCILDNINAIVLRHQALLEANNVKATKENTDIIPHLKESPKPLVSSGQNG